MAKHAAWSAEFMIVRTPLLPWGSLSEWSSLHAASLDEQRTRYREQLKTHVEDPIVREALFVASPSLCESLPAWLENPDSERGLRVERSLVRYFSRMCYRATPFGLFSSCGVADVGSVTSLNLGNDTNLFRHTRLDAGYLDSLCNEINGDQEIRRELTFWQNSSLYRLGDKWRYTRAKLTNASRSFMLVALDNDEFLELVLALAQGGTTISELVQALCDHDEEISEDEAKGYVNELLDSQVLVSTVSPQVTGSEPLPALLTDLSKLDSPRIHKTLARAHEALAAIDDIGLGNAEGPYRDIASHLGELPVETTLSRLFQVDLHRRADKASLSQRATSDILDAVELVGRLMPMSPESSLKGFRDAFVSRYEDSEVPLVEALDEDVGIGFEKSNSPLAEVAPLLAGLFLPGTEEASKVTWGTREETLIELASRADDAAQNELVLSKKDIEKLASSSPARLPDAFFATVTLVGNEEEIRRNRHDIWLRGYAGPSGANLAGRFCHGDPALNERVKAHLEAEEALQPNVRYAEIVHLPEGRVGNVLFRPQLRDYEIPFLGQSGAPIEQQIPIDDLMVSVAGGSVRLRSKRLGCWIAPRLTNAHNHSAGRLAIYRFLCALQNSKGGRWIWSGASGRLPFLPRVRHGRYILSRASWTLNHKQIQTFCAASGQGLLDCAAAWQVERRMPRWVLLIDGDNELPIDLQNILLLETLQSLLNKREGAQLKELYPSPDALCARSSRGLHAHELNIPFVRKEATRIHPPAKEPQPLQRVFPPGSQWLYLKLYCSVSRADEVLSRMVTPILEEHSSLWKQWFFIRYGDPEKHLRIRFQGNASSLTESLLPMLQERFLPLVEEGLISRVQLDTYHREVSRYGGAEGMTLCEEIFQADSKAALEITECLEGAEGEEARWQLTLRGMDDLLQDFGFDLSQKRDLARSLKENFASEFNSNNDLRKAIGVRYRDTRKALVALFDRSQDADSWLVPGFDAFKRRSESVRPLADQLARLDEKGALEMPVDQIVKSLLHMHANRLLQSAARAQEMVLYDFLYRLYQSELAQKKAGSTPQ